jgi:ATP-dependent helicase YprA (DUF1998 family)
MASRPQSDTAQLAQSVGRAGRRPGDAKRLPFLRSNGMIGVGQKVEELVVIRDDRPA